MSKVRVLMIVLLAGSVWGICEALGGGYLYAHGVSHASIPLSLMGLGILAIARFLVPIRGSSLAVAAVAVGYRWLNVGYFPCHLSAILCFGGVFEIVASYLGAERLERRVSQYWLGAGTGMLGFALFGAVMTFGVRSPYWAAEPVKFAGHLINGLIVGGAGLVLVPAVYRASQRVGSWVERAVQGRPVVSLGVSASVLLACWLGIFY